MSLHGDRNTLTHMSLWYDEVRSGSVLAFLGDRMKLAPRPKKAP